MSKVDYIHDHMETPNSKLADDINDSEYFVWIVKEVKRNPNLQPHGSGKGVTPIRQKVMEADDLYTTDQAADYLNMARSTVRDKYYNGNLRAKFYKNVWIMRKKDLDEFKEAQDE